MQTKITLLFCEGKDEPPYIYRLLKTRNWRNWTDKKLRDYPALLYKYLVTEMSKFSSLSDVDQWTNSSSILPSYILKKRGTPENEEHFMCLWNLGGESRVDKAKECIRAFNTIKDSEFEEFGSDDISINLLFFYDADEAVSRRIATIKRLFTDTLPDFCNALTEEAVQRHENVDSFPNCGIYIFSGEDLTGTIEDYLLPIMKRGNEAIFDDAETFIDTHFVAARSEGRKYSKKKAIIGVTGQLQKSGKSNSVIIKDCDYINDPKILADANIQGMINFIEAFCAY